MANEIYQKPVTTDSTRREWYQKQKEAPTKLRVNRQPEQICKIMEAALPDSSSSVYSRGETSVRIRKSQKNFPSKVKVTQNFSDTVSSDKNTMKVKTSELDPQLLINANEVIPRDGPIASIGLGFGTGRHTESRELHRFR